MSTAVRSHAKINLGLYIGAPRSDGFHSLVTVYQTLALYDEVTITARPAPATSLRLTSNDARVPTDAGNTAWKMVDLALNALGQNADVEIQIEKRLPVQGGLGAGSANAVAALIGLEAELGLSTILGAPSFERSVLEGWESTEVPCASAIRQTRAKNRLTPATPSSCQSRSRSGGAANSEYKRVESAP